MLEKEQCGLPTCQEVSWLIYSSEEAQPWFSQWYGDWAKSKMCRVGCEEDLSRGNIGNVQMKGYIFYLEICMLQLS